MKKRARASNRQWLKSPFTNDHGNYTGTKWTSAISLSLTHTQFYFHHNWFALNRQKVLLRKWMSDLWQISEVAGQSEVKFLWLIVSDDPGEDRVLVKVIVGSTSRKKWKSEISNVCVINNETFVTSYMDQTSLPAMVLTKMRYSKLVISLRCQRWVMFAALKSCFGVAREIRLRQKTNNSII